MTEITNFTKQFYETRTMIHGFSQRLRQETILEPAPVDDDRWERLWSLIICLWRLMDALAMVDFEGILTCCDVRSIPILDNMSARDKTQAALDLMDRTSVRINDLLEDFKRMQAVAEQEESSVMLGFAALCESALEQLRILDPALFQIFGAILTCIVLSRANPDFDPSRVNICVADGSAAEPKWEIALDTDSVATKH